MTMRNSHNKTSIENPYGSMIEAFHTREVSLRSLLKNPETKNFANGKR